MILERACLAALFLAAATQAELPSGRRWAVPVPKPTNAGFNDDVVVDVDPAAADPGDLHFAAPADVWGSGPLGAGDLKTVTGSLGLLEVGSLNADAVFDAGGLDSKEVVFQGGINGQSRARVRSARGEVRVIAGVNGESVVEIMAPGGRVVFSPTAVVNGRPRISITAREVEFQGEIGGSAVVDVTLAAQGRLSFARLSGAARLRYRNGEPDGPPPVIAPGTIAAGATLVQEAR